MKLISSKMEKGYRAELIRSNEGLNSPESKLGAALKISGYNTNNAYVLHWTPEQLEDIYTVLIDGILLLSVETDKFDSSKSPIFEKIELSDYKHGLSRTNQVQLAVAQELVNAKT